MTHGAPVVAAALEISRMVALSGYLPGFRQPGVLHEIRIRQSALYQPDLERLDTVFAREFPVFSSMLALEQASLQPLAWRFGAGVCGLLASAGIPLFSAAKILGAGTGDATPMTVRLVIPCLGQDLAMMTRAAKWVVGLMNQLLRGGSADSALSKLPEVIQAIKRCGPRGFNTAGLLRAANELGIPWQRVANNVFQFGWGARARWLDSTFTDRTPNIATGLARSKIDTAAVLRRAGMPVPAHFLAKSVEHAVELADRLGFPVVVKPAALDGGVGVSAGLRHPEAVRRAYQAAKALCPTVMVEKHFEGNDYRLQVYRDEVFWATHRVPGSVVGDGVKDVATLLDELNADPQRGEPGTGHFLKRIPVDEEVLELLVEQGLSLAAVPESGRFVRLRRAANVASGGVPLPVLDVVHPDNLALAIRAARVLRLDIAGVDLLIPDIRQSWLETGAAICEVNAQPQMSPHLPLWLMNKMISGEGRIPVVMLAGDLAGASWFTALLEQLQCPEKFLGVVSTTGVSLAGKRIGRESSVLNGVLSLLGDDSVRGILAVVGEDELRAATLPVDRIDGLVIAAPAGDTAAAFVCRLGPCCKRIWVVDDSGDGRALLGESAGIDVQGVSGAQICNILLSLFENADHEK